jgi:DNA-directed RNA polymerase subunit RPC12/RpoP
LIGYDDKEAGSIAMTFFCFDCNDFECALENREINSRCNECGMEYELDTLPSADDETHCAHCGADALQHFSLVDTDYFINWEDDDDDESFRQWPPEPWRLLE